MPSLKRIRVRTALCSGCLACEIACVAQHERCFGTTTARIRVLKDEENGLDRPQVCRQCPRAPCVSACRAGALSRSDATGAIEVDETLCSGCGDCVAACPFDAIALHPRTGRALICDLCGGDPACTRRCATGAIMVQEGRTSPGGDA